uniref:Secreted protein n=1 Tax=Arundo donax TaxID=35708 RepID=A0A0A9D1D9_ARUDO
MGRLLHLLLLLQHRLLLRRFRLGFRLLPLLLLLEEAEPEDVAERRAGGGLEELAVAAEHAQHLVQRSAAPTSSDPIPARLPRLVR